MKNIVVKESNFERIDKVLAEVQKGCSARLIDRSDIEYAIRQIESKLDIPKSAMTGIVASVDIHAQTFPGSYKWIPMSTHFNVIRTSSGWTLTNVWRGITRGCTQTYSLKLPDKAKEALIKRAELF